MNDDTKRSAYDRLIGAIDGLPNVNQTKPTTISFVSAILGDSQTYVIQTYKTPEGNWIFLQMVNAEGQIRAAIPPRVAAAIYRQAKAVVTNARRQRGRDRWEGMSEKERAAKTSHLRKPKES